MSLAYRVSPVASAFRELLDRVQLTANDSNRFDAHRASIRAALSGAMGFELNALKPIGSFSRGTAVRGTSDADLLAVVTRVSISTAGRLQTSETVLSKFRAVLSTRFWRTEVVRDRQAVVVDFGDGSHPVDVVPAVWQSPEGFNNHPVFSIPDGLGDWMPTSPTSHNRYIQDADKRAGGQLTYAAQLIKYWCATRAIAVPLSGFHIELLLASVGLCEGAYSYSTVTRELLALLARRNCAALNDPIGISGRIPAASSEAKRASAMTSVADAASHADRALSAERFGDEREALRQWNIVFNGHFSR